MKSVKCVCVFGVFVLFGDKSCRTDHSSPTDQEKKGCSEYKRIDPGGFGEKNNGNVFPFSKAPMCEEYKKTDRFARYECC